MNLVEVRFSKLKVLNLVTLLALLLLKDPYLLLRIDKKSFSLVAAVDVAVFDPSLPDDV